MRVYKSKMFWSSLKKKRQNLFFQKNTPKKTNGVFYFKSMKVQFFEKKAPDNINDKISTMNEKVLAFTCATFL